MQLQQDTLFDNRYLLKKLLGCGGFSEVWLVEDVKVGHKKMALKVFVPDKGLDDDGVQLFSSEFELVFDLNHTNLLRPAHFDVCERSPYLLMPYSEQGSANKLVGRFDEEEAWQFLHDVSAGLAFLHAQNPPIIHQDIKPDNILKDYLGHYQITDFGISTKARSTLRKSMSAARSGGGTMAYMPPERFGRENTPIKASDIWSAGATLFELLAGDLPFGEHGGLMQKSGADIPQLPGKWSKELDEIIFRCLQKEPWDRPIAQQIVEWTDKHFKGEKIIFEKKKTKPPSKKIMIGIGGCVLAALLAFITVKFFIPYVNDNKQGGVTVVDPNGQGTNPGGTTVIDPTGQGTGITTSPNSQGSQNTPDSTTSGTSTTSPTTTSPTTTTSGTSTTSPTTTSPTTPTTETPSTPTPPDWLTDYNRIFQSALNAYRGGNYKLAKSEYQKALNLAKQNGDGEKEKFVNREIAECNKAIEAAAKAEEEALQQQIQERLANYNFAGNFALGSEYWIVQRKSDNRWGIIKKDGNEVETCNYSQVSARLKNGYYALKNELGWVVFDTSLHKVAEGLVDLNDYR